MNVTPKNVSVVYERCPAQWPAVTQIHTRTQPMHAYTHCLRYWFLGITLGRGLVEGAEDNTNSLDFMGRREGGGSKELEKFLKFGSEVKLGAWRCENSQCFL